jgi:hypothetical protein
MAGTGFHPEGHVTKPYTGTLKGVKVICVNCAGCDPDPDSECIDDC